MKKLILFILALMMILGSLVGALAFVNPSLLNEFQDRRFWYARFKSEPVDLLVLGDSRMYRGFNPDLGLNFAFSSNSYTESYLEMALTKVKEKGVVIMGITPQSLTDYNLDDHFRLMRDQSQNVFTEAYHLVDTLVPRSNLFAFMSGDKLPWKAHAQDANVIYHANGWMETQAIVKNDVMGKSSYTEAFRAHTFNPDYPKFIEGFIKKAQGKGIKVYLVYPPTSKEVFELENNFAVSKMKVFEEIKRLEQATGAKFIDFPEMHVMDTFDGDHLDSESAKKYTKAVMDSISQRP